MSQKQSLRAILLTSMALSLTFLAAPCPAGPPSFLRLFGKKKVEADPSNEYRLTEVEGPWMILAATFTGDSGARKSRQLVMELRSEYNLPAYVYREDFDFTQQVGLFEPTQKPLRYANAARFNAYAVLVGEFDSVNHPEIEKALETVKIINPPVFNQLRAEDEVGAMASIRRIKNQILQASKEAEVKRGPMYNAFVTRNPLLPEDFTQAPEVDSFVQKLNQNVEHSLLECDGKFTVVVRTFEGLSTTMVGGRIKDEMTPSKERLDQSMAMAHKMVEALRKDGVEAFEFHDRSKSLVTVGSFDSLGENLRSGFQYSPQIQNIMRVYAGTERIGRNPQGEVVRYVHNIEKIPFDPEPHPIAVPRASKRGLYSAFGRK